MVTSHRLADIGLETFKLSELFTSIVIPGFFLLACILQLHYFHKPFMKLTDLEHVTPVHRQGHTFACRHTHKDKTHARVDEMSIHQCVIGVSLTSRKKSGHKSEVRVGFEEEDLGTDLGDDESEDEGEN